VRSERAIHALERLLRLSRLQELLRFFELIGACGSRADKSADAKQENAATQTSARGVGLQHCVIFSRPYVRVLILDERSPVHNRHSADLQFAGPDKTTVRPFGVRSGAHVRLW